MSQEKLRSFTSFLTNRMVVIRQSYRDRLMQNELSQDLAKESLSFEVDAMYESWVNFAPHFFREMYLDFDLLIKSGFQADEIAMSLGTTARIPRYYTQLLLPGAYLDTTISLEEKKIFLGLFVDVVRKVYEKPQYNQPNFESLYDKSVTSEEMKLALAGRLIPRLEEACESIYFGDQNIGFPEFGLIKRGIPDHVTLSQTFDLNLGQRQFPGFSRVKTYTTYSEESTEGRLTNFLDIYVGSLFMHAQMIDTKWRLRRPAYWLLERGYATVDDKVLSVGEINILADRVPMIAKIVEKDRSAVTLVDRELEYCYVQSLPLRELGQLLGKKSWCLSDGAVNSISSQESSSRLKKDWVMNHSVEVSTELIKRSVEWVKNLEV